MVKAHNNKIVGSLIRTLFQDMLKAHVKTKAERQKLAKILGVSESSINGMLYTGNGGLDNWACAIAHYYNLNEESLKNLSIQMKKEIQLTESDKIWYSIDVPEERKLKLAMIAKAVSEIENKLEHL